MAWLLLAVQSSHILAWNFSTLARVMELSIFAYRDQRYE